MAENFATWEAREKRLEEAGELCPDCNEPFVSPRGVRAHKQRGGCVPLHVTGARDRMAELIARAITYYGREYRGREPLRERKALELRSFLTRPRSQPK